MNDQVQRVKELTTLMCYIRAADYFDEDDTVQRLAVTWFHWAHTWRCTITKYYVGGSGSTTISNNPLCKYIIKECFKEDDMVTIEVEVIPPNSHQIMEATWQLAETLGPDVNLDEILY